MGTKSFDVCQGCDDRSEDFQSICCEFLGSDMFLEGLGIDPTELASVSVCWKRVICAGGVVPATVHSY